MLMKRCGDVPRTATKRPRHFGASLLIALFTLSACGVGGAVRDTAGVFDNLGCASRDLKGEEPCPPRQPAP